MKLFSRKFRPVKRNHFFSQHTVNLWNSSSQNGEMVSSIDSFSDDAVLKEDWIISWKRELLAMMAR